jgi:hypothetical protein
MLSDTFKQAFETFEELPGEIGTEAIHQIKGQGKANNSNDSQGKTQDLSNTNDPSKTSNDTSLLNDLYGVQSLSPEQIKLKQEQDKKIQNQMYQKIQQDIAQFRAEKSQVLTAQEAAQQKGTKAVKTQEEKMELWQEEAKKREEEQKKVEDITMPGSQQSRSGEQAQIMG